MKSANDIAKPKRALLTMTSEITSTRKSFITVCASKCLDSLAVASRAIHLMILLGLMEDVILLLRMRESILDA